MGSFSWIIFSVMLVQLLILLKKPVISHSPVPPAPRIMSFTYVYKDTFTFSQPLMSYSPYSVMGLSSS